MVKSRAAKVCILSGVVLLLAAGFYLAWYFLTGQNNDGKGNNSAEQQQQQQGGGGIFGTGLFGKDNETTAAPTLLFGDNDVTVTPAPSAAPSIAPTEYQYPFNQCSPKATACCNGLENLCDWPVNKILFGVLHNAMATEDKFLVFNHLEPMDKAIQAGYRGVNLDVCNCQGFYKFCHGFCGLGEQDPVELLTSLVTFLNENPNEVLLLALELNSNAGQKVDLDDFYNTVLKNIDGFTDYLYFHGDNRSEPWPTLGKLIENETRLLAFHLNGPTCQEAGECPEGLHYYFSYIQDTEFDFDSVEQILDVSNSCLITRGATTTTGAFFAVNNFITPSALDDIDNQLQVAETINSLEFANERIQACAEFVQAGVYYGDGDVSLLYVDFWNIGDIVQVVQEHNQNLGIRDESI